MKYEIEVFYRTGVFYDGKEVIGKVYSTADSEHEARSDAIARARDGFFVNSNDKQIALKFFPGHSIVKILISKVKQVRKRSKKTT